MLFALVIHQQIQRLNEEQIGAFSSETLFFCEKLKNLAILRDNENVKESMRPFPAAENSFLEFSTVLISSKLP